MSLDPAQAHARGLAFAASTLAFALAATDASAQTGAVATRVDVHVDCSGPCRANIGVTVPAPAPQPYTLPPAYPYPPGYVLVPVWYSSLFDSRYSYPNVTRGTPERDGAPAAFVLGVLGLIGGVGFLVGGAVGNQGHGEGAPYLVFGAILAVAGLAGVGAGAVTEHRQRANLRLTAGVAMTQGGAVLGAGVVF